MDISAMTPQQIHRDQTIVAKLQNYLQRPRHTDEHTLKPFGFTEAILLDPNARARNADSDVARLWHTLSDAEKPALIEWLTLAKRAAETRLCAEQVVATRAQVQQWKNFTCYACQKKSSTTKGIVHDYGREGHYHECCRPSAAMTEGKLDVSKLLEGLKL
jgi:hypothetical protein